MCEAFPARGPIRGSTLSIEVAGEPVPRPPEPLASAPSPAPSTSPASSSGNEEQQESANDDELAFGVKAVQGKRPSMEDAFSVVTRVGHRGDPSSSAASPARGQAPSAGTSPTSVLAFGQSVKLDDELAFFGVFDGHGGKDVSAHCATRMACNLEAAVASAHAHAPHKDERAAADDEPMPSRVVIDFGNPRAGLPAEPDAASTRYPANCSSSSPLALAHALRSAFTTTDNELVHTDAGEYVGSTAVVALVGPRHIWVANAGAELGDGWAVVPGARSWRAAPVAAAPVCALLDDHFSAVIHLPRGSAARGLGYQVWPVLSWHPPPDCLPSAPATRPAPIRPTPPSPTDAGA